MGGVARFSAKQWQEGGRERSDRHGRGVSDQERERWGMKGEGSQLLAGEVGKAQVRGARGLDPNAAALAAASCRHKPHC
eukprot:277988-Chlamydomonas_euryale.AAC.2